MHSSALLLLFVGGAQAFAPSLRPSFAGTSRRSAAYACGALGLAAKAGDVDRRSMVGTAAAAGLGALVGSPEEARAAEDTETMVMMTTAGEMQFEFWSDVAPKTVESFKKLAKTGYFDGLAFHRIIPGFVIQGGDPNTKKGYGPDGTLKGADINAVRKWGTGGPGFNIKAEFNERKHEFGVLSMARSADPDSAGSQFFVCLGNLPSLDKKYTTFGKMTKGDDVLKKIASAKTVKGDYPIERQGIETVTIVPKK